MFRGVPVRKMCLNDCNEPDRSGGLTVQPSIRRNHHVELPGFQLEISRSVVAT